MAWAKPTTITSWSFSRWKMYSDCPLKLKLSAIDKIKEPPSPAMTRGNDIHKLAEDYIKGKLKKLPDELTLFPKFFKLARDRFKKSPTLISVEDTWSFRKDWTITRWDDWIGCWLRVKVDVCLIDTETVSIIDHKTGKYSPQYNLEDYMLQMDLYALSALVYYAGLGAGLKVLPRLHFLDHEIVFPEPGSKDIRVYTPTDLPRLKKEWESRAKPMLADKQFSPKPNRWCPNCFFRASNKAGGGGQCKF
jgi:hypothetical protein